MGLKRGELSSAAQVLASETEKKNYDRSADEHKKVFEVVGNFQTSIHSYFLRFCLYSYSHLVRNTMHSLDLPWYTMLTPYGINMAYHGRTKISWYFLLEGGGGRVSRRIFQVFSGKIRGMTEKGHQLFWESMLL